LATGTIFLGRDELLRLLHQQPEPALDLIRDFSGRLQALSRRNLDDSLQTERPTTVDRLARSTVHDFKNPLAIISLAAELAGRRWARSTGGGGCRTRFSSRSSA
jgi:signal transduction histidine kinase